VHVCYTVCSAVSRGAFALFAETSSSTADSVISFSRTLQVPLVTPSAPLDMRPVDRRRPGSNDAAQVLAPADTVGYVAFMRPPYQRAIADVIQYYKWTRVFYLYDNSEGIINTLLDMSQLQSRMPLKFRQHASSGRLGSLVVRASDS